VLMSGWALVGNASGNACSVSAAPLPEPELSGSTDQGHLSPRSGQIGVDLATVGLTLDFFLVRWILRTLRAYKNITRTT